MARSENPGARLEKIVMAAYGRVTSGIGAPQAWAEAMKADPNEPADQNLNSVLVRGVKLFRLTAYVRDLMARLPDEPYETRLNDFEEVEAVVGRFHSLGNTTLAAFFAGFEKTGARALGRASAVLGRRGLYQTIDLGKIEEIRKRIKETRDCLRDEDITPADAKWLDDALTDLENALDLVHLDGAEPVQNVADRIHGGLITRPVVMERLKNSPAGRNLLLLYLMISSAISTTSAGLQLVSLFDSEPAPASIINVYVDTIPPDLQQALEGLRPLQIEAGAPADQEENGKPGG